MLKLLEQGISPSPEYYGGLLDHGLQVTIAIRPVEGGTYTYANDNLFFSPRIGIMDSVRKETIDLLVNKFPGNRYNGRKVEKKRDRYGWIITSNEDSLTFLEEAIPLLTVKKAQTLVMRDYLMRRIQREHGRMLPEDRLAEDQEFYKQFLEAKKSDEATVPKVVTPQRLAGITDIGVSLGIGRGKGDSRSIYRLFFSYQTSETSLLQMFQSRYQVGEIVPVYERADGRTTHAWKVLDSEAEAVFIDLAPHLIYSQPLAELGIVFQAIQRHLGEEYINNRTRSKLEAQWAGYESGKKLRDMIRESYRQRMLSLRYGNSCLHRRFEE